MWPDDCLKWWSGNVTTVGVCTVQTGDLLTSPAPIFVSISSAYCGAISPYRNSPSLGGGHIRLRFLMGLLRFRKHRGHKIHKQPPNGNKPGCGTEGRPEVLAPSSTHWVLETLTPECIWRWTSREAKWGHSVSLWADRISVLIGRDSRDALSVTCILCLTNARVICAREKQLTCRNGAPSRKEWSAAFLWTYSLKSI